MMDFNLSVFNDCHSHFSSECLITSKQLTAGMTIVSWINKSKFNFRAKGFPLNANATEDPSIHDLWQHYAGKRELLSLDAGYSP